MRGEQVGHAVTPCAQTFLAAAVALCANVFNGKGYLEGVQLSADGRKVVLNFYDIARLTQDTDNDVQESGFFYMQNVVIVESVTRENIEAAAHGIAKTVLK
jgi:hypothetical protein